ncbi:hypothetical protein MMC26_000139 [Xylographa opegraphella]|nr:hypothetical protein [Xylographa opegraphella]
MAVNVESSRRTNVLQGLNNLSQGFNSFMSREPLALSPLSRTNSNALKRKPVGEDAAAGNRPAEQTAQKPVPKTHRKWDSFGRGKGSQESSDRNRSPQDSPYPSPNLRSPMKAQSASSFSLNQKHLDHDSCLPRRRKGSVSDLLLDKMTTVQECSMDSPTIPGRPPTQPNSRNSPEPSEQNSPATADRGSLTPRAMTSAPNLKHDGDDNQLGLEFDTGKSIRRASSLLLPCGLAPLVIPANDLCILPAEAYRPSEEYREEGRPPKVPPKSPRTINRAYPQSAKATLAFPQSIKSSLASANNSTSTVHIIQTRGTLTTANGSPDDAKLNKPWSAPIRSAGFPSSSPQKLQRDFSTANDQISSPPWSAREHRSTPSRQMRFGMSIDETATIKTMNALKSGKSTPEPVQTGHQRGVSENSVINRGRPTRKPDASLQRILQKCTEDDRAAKAAFGDLPEGISNAKAISIIPIDELRNLKKHAEASAAAFRVLREMEVSDLSQELHILNERCEYLRKTYDSLREGRRGLHDRIFAYLSALRPATFAMENIVKQEDALIELDVSIDEWAIKLEHAKDRRYQIRQKLLEHIAAIAMLRIPDDSRSNGSAEAQTPPRSPEKVDRSFSSERRDVESIRVYADSGVASLLASIEKELGIMGEQKRFD